MKLNFIKNLSDEMIRENHNLKNELIEQNQKIKSRYNFIQIINSKWLLLLIRSLRKNIS